MSKNILLKDFNLSDLDSEFINNIEGDVENLTLPIDFADIILDFNQRKVNPSNINKIIKICDYFMINDTNSFIIKYSEPTEEIYKLDDINKDKIKLPDFMTGKMSYLEIVKHDLLNWFTFMYSIKKEIEYFTLGEIIETGNLKIIKYIFNNIKLDLDKYQSSHLCNFAASSGNLECLQYIHKDIAKNNIDDSTCDYSAKKGNLDCLKYAVNHEFYYDFMTFVAAADSGNVNCLQYLYDVGCKLVPELVANHSVEKGYLECLKFVIEKKPNTNLKNTFKKALNSGKLNCFKYLHENNYGKLDDKMFIIASKNGHLDIFKYLHQKIGPPKSKFISLNSVVNGHLDILKYMIENKMILHEELDKYAKNNNQLNCYQYLKMLSFPIP